MSSCDCRGVSPARWNAHHGVHTRAIRSLKAGGACTAGRGRSRLEQELEQANARRPVPSRGGCICGKALGKSKRARGEFWPLTHPPTTFFWAAPCTETAGLSSVAQAPRSWELGGVAVQSRLASARAQNTTSDPPTGHLGHGGVRYRYTGGPFPCPLPGGTQHVVLHLLRYTTWISNCRI
jgi:hypothetical protein